MNVTERERRFVAALTALAGLAHLLVPGALLRTARRAYRRVLAVEFHPRPAARRRVRAVGVGLLALAGLLARYTDDST